MISLIQRSYHPHNVGNVSVYLELQNGWTLETKCRATEYIYKYKKEVELDMGGNFEREITDNVLLYNEELDLSFSDEYKYPNLDWEKLYKLIKSWGTKLEIGDDFKAIW